MILLESLVPLGVRGEFYSFFEVAVQLGAILAVILHYRKRLLPFGKDDTERKSALRLWGLTLIAVIPSGVIGLLFDDALESLFYNPPTVAAMLVLYGIGFIAVERYRKGRVPALSHMSEVTPKKALGVGLFQTLALIPGTSRSGATILGACLLGASRPLAAEFSFFLAIPTMFGAGVLRGVGFFAEGNALTPHEAVILAVGTLTAFAVSAVTVKFLTDIVRRHSFSAFGIYRIILGTAVLICFFTGRL
jgi:undecaprenyl-diphosphatase